MPQFKPGRGNGHGVSIRRAGRGRSWTNRLVALMTALMMAVSLFAAPATALADDLGVTLPNTWDQDMAQYFPDETLRTLVTQEIANENKGQDLSAKSTQDVLASMKGDYNNGTWYLNFAYKRSGLKPVQVLNGIQYLNGLTRIIAENIGLQVLAMPDVSSSERIPDLNLGGNPLRIFPQDMYPEKGYNFPQTRTMNIQVSEVNYHHAQVTYVRDGSKQAKDIDINAKIFHLKNSETGDLSQITSEQVLDQMRFSLGTGDQSFTTVGDTTVSKADSVGWDITIGGGKTTRDSSGTAVDGLVVKDAQYDEVVKHRTDTFNNNTVTLRYYYTVDVSYLSTVDQQVSAVTLADFSFTKTADATGQPLKGAEYVIKTDDDRYVKGKDGKAEVDATGKLATVPFANSDGVLKLTTDENGQFTVQNLPASADGVQYKVVEVKAPDGYFIDEENNTTPVTVTCHESKATPVTEGGEGKSAEITNSNVTATADQWDSNSLTTAYLPAGQVNPNGTNIDFARSGSPMTITSNVEGVPVTQTVNASAYNGGDVFIRNGGNDVVLGVQLGDGFSVRNASTELVSGANTDGKKKVIGEYKADSTDKDPNAAATTLTQAQNAINGIIQSSGMTQDSDYYNVNTTMVVHDDNSLELNKTVVDGDNSVNVQKDQAKPVKMRFSAKKLLTDLAGNAVDFGDRTFEVAITPDNKAAEDLVKTSENTGFTGPITLDKNNTSNKSSTLTISNETYKNWRGKTGDGGQVATFSFIAGETNPCEAEGSSDNEGCYADVKYDDTRYRIDIAVSETPEPNEQGVTHGLTANITVTNLKTGKPVATTATNSSASDPITVGVDKITYHNKVSPDFKFTKTDADGKTLAGAEFSLYRCTTGNCPATAIDPDNLTEVWKLDQNRTQTSDENGIVTFTGLADGEYRLVETRAPEDYLKPDGQWSIVVKDGKVGTPSAVRGPNGGYPPAFQIVADQNDGTGVSDDRPAWSVANYKPSDVPYTGATGLTGVAAAGTLLITAGAGVIAIDAKRRSRRTRS